MQSTASPPIRLTVGANFVADPIRESLEYWFGAHKMPAAIEFLPQDQLIQQLLDPSRLLASSPDYFLVLLQLERWIPDGPDSRGAPLRNYKDFTDALGIAALRASTQFIVIVCPSLP